LTRTRPRPRPRSLTRSRGSWSCARSVTPPAPTRGPYGPCQATRRLRRGRAGDRRVRRRHQPRALSVDRERPRFGAEQAPQRRKRARARAG
jgi:hypothetical protein